MDISSKQQILTFKNTQRIMRPKINMQRIRENLIKAVYSMNVLGFKKAKHCKIEKKKSKFYCLRQCASKRGCQSAIQSLRQASRQSDRNTQFGFFVSGRCVPKHSGDLSP